jgi:hypothetical protein
LAIAAQDTILPHMSRSVCLADQGFGIVISRQYLMLKISRCAKIFEQVFISQRSPLPPRALAKHGKMPSTAQAERCSW